MKLLFSFIIDKDGAEIEVGNSGTTVPGLFHDGAALFAARITVSPRWA